MSLEKAKLRERVFHEVGVKFDDLLEEARFEAERRKGAKKALVLAAAKVTNHEQKVDQAFAQGALTQSQSDLVRKYVRQCGGIVRNLLESSQIGILEQSGSVKTLEMCVMEVKRLHEIELEKAVILEMHENGEIPESDDPKDRYEGIHPGSNIKDKRIEEDKIEEVFVRLRSQRD